MGVVKGYKATDKNGQCRGVQFEVGKTYTVDGRVQLCVNGFHFCQNLFDVYNYYAKSSDTRIFEVEAIDPITEGDKSCTGQITFARELTDKERLEAWIKRTNSGYYNSGYRNSGYYNSGDYNSGYYNSGDYNSGDYNSGNYNSGDYNSGNYNSGDYNSGYYNSGDYNSGNYNSGYYNSGNYNSGYYNSGYYNSGYRNSGYYNSGDYNSGYYNSGDYNSGDYNSGNYNSGFFNTQTPFVRLFNKTTKLRWDDPIVHRLRSLPVKPILRWVSTSQMTDEQKKNYPSHATTGGFLANTGRTDWSGLTRSDLNFIRSLPNFDAEVFLRISGLDLRKGEG